jgi:hypothetical protein
VVACSKGVTNENTWIYTEEADKLNNSKIYKARRYFEGQSNLLYAKTEFSCDSEKILVLEITSYKKNVDGGENPGVALRPEKPYFWKNVGVIKTRSGSEKIIFPVVLPDKYSNLTTLFISGYDNSNYFFAIAGLPDMEGYKNAVNREEISKLLQIGPWIVEIPTVKGSIIAEIDLTEKSIQKVFKECAWPNISGK